METDDLTEFEEKLSKMVAPVTALPAALEKRLFEYIDMRDEIALPLSKSALAVDLTPYLKEKNLATEDIEDGKLGILCIWINNV